jgi:hypothetical protein
MKIIQVSVTISQTIAVAKYETIKPSVTLTAELEDGDNAAECVAELHKQVAPMWARNTLVELAWVASRRKEDQKHEFNQTTGQTRQQVKGMMKK